MRIDTVKVSNKAFGQLKQLKKVTKIENWNILCRWAFCLSIAEESIPPEQKIVTDSSVEMTWKTFAGEYGDIYLALLKQRLVEEGKEVSKVNLEKWFKIHLHRGIGYLGKG